MNEIVVFCARCGARLATRDDSCLPCRDAEAVRATRIVDYAPPTRLIEVFFFCAMCNTLLRDEHDVCLHCCGAEAMPGRCGLELGHAGEHEPPAVASPLPAQDDTTLEDDGEELPDRPPGCDWCGGRGCDICCAPGYVGVEYDPW